MRIHSRNVLYQSLFGACIFVFIFLLFYGHPDVGIEERVASRRIAELRDRLVQVETLNQQRLNDLAAARTELKYFFNTKQNMSAENLTNLRDGSMDSASFPLFSNLGRDLTSPGIHHYMPHLVGHPEALKPRFKISERRLGVSLVIGIPTVKREKENYLLETLKSLIDGSTEEDKKDCVLVIFIAEPEDDNFVASMTKEIQKLYPEELKSGFIEVIAPPASFYPNWSDLNPTFGDSHERAKWRTKQNLDYAFLWMYAHAKGTYFVQLEDDVVTRPGYVTTMKSFALSQKSNDWILLEFSSLGFIGKLFKSRDLMMLTNFILMFHRDKPVDWLLDHLLYTRVCNPEKDGKNCERMKDQVRLKFKPSLFQHIGIHSSLKGKLQKLKDKGFGKNELFRAHSNPAADVSTTLKIYQQYTLDSAYKGENFFWAMAPKAGDVIEIRFQEPIVIERFYFKSGNAEHANDRLLNTTVEVLPVSNSQQSDGQIEHAVPNYPKTKDGYLIVGNFSTSSGVAQDSVHNDTGPISCIRLFIHSTSESWIILSEILVKPLKRPTST